MSAQPAARVGDKVAHTMALPGALTGLLVGAAIGVFIVSTGGLGAIAVGAAIATTGGMGLAGQYIGESSMGPPTGAIVEGSSTIFINGKPAARATLSTALCREGPPQKEATGAKTVYFDGMPAGRKEEKLTCSAKIIEGSGDVFIGGPSEQTLPMDPEVPEWLSKTMTAMMWGGAILATGGSIAAYGLGATLGYGALGFIGSQIGSQLGRAGMAALGFGETGQRFGEVLGGIAGGAGAVRGGQWFNRNYKVSVDPSRLGMNGGNIRVTPRVTSSFQKPTTGSWKNAPNPDKWVRKGGSIHQHRDGSVTYVNKAGHKVKYSATGEPNFKPHAVDQTVLPGGFKGRAADFRAANNATGRPQYGGRSPPKQTWHHHEDGKTMQLLPRKLHREFTHSGGISRLFGP